MDFREACRWWPEFLFWVITPLSGMLYWPQHLPSRSFPLPLCHSNGSIEGATNDYHVTWSLVVHGTQLFRGEGTFTRRKKGRRRGLSKDTITCVHVFSWLTRLLKPCGRAFFSGLFPGDNPAVKSAQCHVHGSTHSAFLMQSCLTWSTWRAKQIPKYVDFKSTLTTFQSHIKIHCNLPCQDLSARPSHMVFITHSCKPGELCFISC